MNNYNLTLKEVFSSGFEPKTRFGLRPHCLRRQNEPKEDIVYSLEGTKNGIDQQLVNVVSEDFPILVDMIGKMKGLFRRL